MLRDWTGREQLHGAERLFSRKIRSYSETVTCQMKDHWAHPQLITCIHTTLHYGIIEESVWRVTLEPLDSKLPGCFFVARLQLYSDVWFVIRLSVKFCLNIGWYNSTGSVQIWLPLYRYKLVSNWLADSVCVGVCLCSAQTMTQIWNSSSASFCNFPPVSFHLAQVEIFWNHIFVWCWRIHVTICFSSFLNIQ